MKASVVLALGLGVVAMGTGCSTSSRRTAPPSYYSEYSTAVRLWNGECDIEQRAKSLERKGLSAEEARQYAEIEYLKSGAGSPLR